MRLLRLLLLAGFLCNTPAWAAMTVTNCNTGTPASATTMTVTCSSVAAGDLLALTFLSNNNVAVSSVSDSVDGTNGWTAAFASTSFGVIGNLAWYVAPNRSGSGSTVTVTVQFVSATGGGEIALKRISNADTSSPVDGAGCSTSGTGTAPSCALTTSNANTLLLASLGLGASKTVTVGGSFGNALTPDGFTKIADRYVTASGSQTINPFSWTGSTSFGQIAIAIKEAAGGAVATPRRRPIYF
ncbi:MAG TPA: hypothetical protein VG892_02905 [Terriglobales bacterium]|nr:hypothetical protein [Terriglobales bacterium]